LRDFKMSDKLTYTKKDLINEIHKKVDIPKDKIKLILEVTLDSMNDIFTQEKSGIRLEIRNFGVFKVQKTKPKPKARNPKTNEIVHVPSRRKISFKAGKKINQKLKKEWNE
tara:strand:- start:9 stop:341 length:333 start_codon:yes stop_codon:yes gene_type:complete